MALYYSSHLFNLKMLIIALKNHSKRNWNKKTISKHFAMAKKWLKIKKRFQQILHSIYSLPYFATESSKLFEGRFYNASKLNNT